MMWFIINSGSKALVLKFLHGALMREEYWQPSVSGHLVFVIFTMRVVFPCEDCNENI